MVHTFTRHWNCCHWIRMIKLPNHNIHVYQLISLTQFYDRIRWFMQKCAKKCTKTLYIYIYIYALPKLSNAFLFFTKDPFFFSQMDFYSVFRVLMTSKLSVIIWKALGSSKFFFMALCLTYPNQSKNTKEHQCHSFWGPLDSKTFVVSLSFSLSLNA